MSTTTTKPPVPVVTKIHQRVYRAASRPDALNMRDWHSCDTTHCWAGWITTIAGPAGFDLELYHAGSALNFRAGYGTEDAACDILEASISNGTLVLDTDYFYEDDDDALVEMKRLADEEAALVGPLGDDE